MNRQTIQKERRRLETALAALDALEKSLYGTTGNSRRTPNKLSKTQRARLLRSYNTGRYTAKTLADKYGVSRSYVYQLSKK